MGLGAAAGGADALAGGAGAATLGGADAAAGSLDALAAGTYDTGLGATAGADVLPAASTLDALTTSTIPGTATPLSTAFSGTAAAPSVGGFDLSTIGPGTDALTGASGAPTDLLSATASGAGTPLAAAPGAATGAASNTPGWLQGLQTTLGPVNTALKSVAPIAGLGGLGYNLYQGYETNQANKSMENQINATAATQAATSAADTAAAQPLVATGEQLQNYLTTGTLPQAFQTQIQQTVDAQKAQIIQGYGARGQSTDPSQNSALAQDLANVDNQKLTLQATIESQLQQAGASMVQQATSMLQQGSTAAQISAQLPVMVAQLNQSLNTATANSIASFAKALGGSNTPSFTVAQNAQGGLAFNPTT